MALPTRSLGTLQVSAQGLGCMVEAATLQLTTDELARIDAVAPATSFSGSRYPAAAMRGIGI